MQQHEIKIYTDGSCHTQYLIGAWVAIIFIGAEKIILSAVENTTTHNRMELTAIIKAIECIEQRNLMQNQISIITDSQYAIGLQAREQKFTSLNFTTKKGNDISNADLVKAFLLLTKYPFITFVKIKAHQKQGTETNYNIEADKVSRQLVRQAVNSYKLISTS